MTTKNYALTVAVADEQINFLLEEETHGQYAYEQALNLH